MVNISKKHLFVWLQYIIKPVVAVVKVTLDLFKFPHHFCRFRFCKNGIKITQEKRLIFGIGKGEFCFVTSIFWLPLWFDIASSK